MSRHIKISWSLATGYKSIIGSPFTIGITGTNGKTTVTQLTTEILKTMLFCKHYSR